tara:strand:+ start:3575 stop:3802 length:228 start_codon:yes stop_codon:yes gene_type:complete
MRRTSSTIPFGYKLDEENPSYLLEIPEEKEALDKISSMIKNKALSLREGSSWLQYETGRYISHMGLKKIVDKHAK